MKIFLVNILYCHAFFPPYHKSYELNVLSAEMIFKNQYNDYLYCVMNELDWSTILGYQVSENSLKKIGDAANRLSCVVLGEMPQVTVRYNYQQKKVKYSLGFSYIILKGRANWNEWKRI